MAEKTRTSPDLPWNTRLFMFSMGFAVDLSCRPNLTVNRLFFNLLDRKCSASDKPRDGVKTSDITVDESRNLWFRLFTPTDPSPTSTLPVIIYFHGGGFVFMAANSKGFDDYCRKLSRELLAIIISVDYRLAPENRCPCQYDDGIDVLKFIDSTNIEGFPDSADLNRCFVAGDSAGGNIAHNVAVRANDHSFCKMKLRGVIAIQPFFGGEERTESETRLIGAPLVSMERADWMWKAFLPKDSNRDHPVVNVFGPKGVDISGINFPATLVFVGGFDPLQDWQKRYYEGLKKSGKEAYLIEYPNACHGFYFIPELKERSLLITEVKNFIKNQSAK